MIAFAAGLGPEGRSHCFNLNRLLASLQSKFGFKFPSSGSVDLDEGAKAEVLFWKEIEKHEPFSFYLENRKSLNFKVYTDSSSNSYGIKMDKHQVRGSIPLDILNEPILVKECFGFYVYIRDFAPPDSNILMLTDSKALFYNYKKKASRNQKVNDYLMKSFKILREKKSAVQLEWICTAVMKAEGADGLSRNFMEEFRDDKSLSPRGVDRLLVRSGLRKEVTVDLFASKADNVLSTSYCHICWDRDDPLALGLDAFAYLEDLFGKKIEFHIYAYPPLGLVDNFIQACAGLSLGRGGKLVILVPEEKAVAAKLALNRLGRVVLVPFCRRNNREVLKTRSALALTLVLVSILKRKI